MTHYDSTMDNDVARDVHFHIAMGNDIAQDTYCDVTMSKTLQCVHIMVLQCIMTLLWTSVIMYYYS